MVALKKTYSSLICKVSKNVLVSILNISVSVSGSASDPKSKVSVSRKFLKVSVSGASQLVTRSTRHSPKSYDKLTGG